MDEVRRDETLRHKIVDAYLELLKEKSSEDISITEITQCAGVSRMAFYRKFTSKEEIVDFYLGGIFHWEICWVEELGRELDIWELEFGIRFFEVMKQHREHILLLVDRGYATLLLQVINMTNEMRSGDMPVHSIHRYDLYFLAGAGFNSMLIGCKESPEEMARALASYMSGKHLEQPLQ